MKKYVTFGINNAPSAFIEEIEVERETEDSVWIDGSRVIKVTGWEIIHDTWEDAHKFISEWSMEAIKTAQSRLERMVSFYGEVSNMERPISKEDARNSG